MDIKKLLLISLIVVAIIASVSAVSAGWFDDFFGGPQDNVIEIDGITFNTTNATNFTNVVNETGNLGFINDNGQGKYTVYITNYSAVDNPTSFKLSLENRIDNAVKKEVNGVVIYTTTAEMGEYVGEPRYFAHVYNSDLNTEVLMSSPNPNETAKMTLSLKFK